ncbi:MAG: beta-propeller fold lactonase family protein [Rhizonema sp. NSF051]|nr:beta-propeller fold lactonase family protein [Rhizonema sp. NSF051]
MALLPITGKINRQIHTIGFTIAGFTATLLVGGFLVQSADAYRDRTSTTGVVYTESNTPTENGENENTVLGFQRDADGNLTPLPTSPFSTGGAGIRNAGGITVQNVIANSEHTRLFAINSGSNTIAVFDINQQDGSLSPVEGSPFPSGGVNPVSLGLAKDILYVVNRNKDPKNPSQDASGSLPNYTAFRVTPKGRLIPVSGSTVSDPTDSRPTQALISQDKHLLFGVDRGSGLLRSFQILRGGRLLESPNSPQPLPASEFSPGTPQATVLGSGTPQATALGLQEHPKLPILYVGFFTINKLGVYSFDPRTGKLLFLKTVPNSGQLVCWLTTNRAGTRLYTSNPGDNSISVYDIATDPTTPVEIQNVKLHGSGGSADLTLDPTESFLQAVSQGNSPNIAEGNGLDVLKVNPQDGTLSEVSSSPFPLPSVNGSVPLGIVAK